MLKMPNRESHSVTDKLSVIPSVKRGEIDLPDFVDAVDSTDPDIDKAVNVAMELIRW